MEDSYFVILCWFYHTSTWINHRYTYVPSLLNLPPHPSLLGCHGALALGSLCHAANSHWLWACLLSCFSHVWLFVALKAVAHQAPLSMRFSRQEYWSGLPCPPPGISLAQRWKPHLLILLHWQVGSLPLVTPGKPLPLAITGHIPWGNHNWKRHMYPNVHCSTVYNRQDMEAA